MGLIRYFFDTYALYEFFSGNKKYKKYFEQYDIITGDLNLIELFYHLLKNFGLEEARRYYRLLKPFTIKISDDIIEKSMIFRFKYKKQKLSYADCIGYTLSLNDNLIFLTGDKEFENFEKVEYVNN